MDITGKYFVRYNPPEIPPEDRPLMDFIGNYLEPFEISSMRAQDLIKGREENFYQFMKRQIRDSVSTSEEFGSSMPSDEKLDCALRAVLTGIANPEGSAES